MCIDGNVCRTGVWLRLLLRLIDIQNSHLSQLKKFTLLFDESPEPTAQATTGSVFYLPLASSNAETSLASSIA